MIADTLVGMAGFVPLDRARVAVAHDGTLAAIHEPLRVVVVEVPGCAAFAEVGIDPDAIESEAAGVGAPPRVIVVAQYRHHSAAHLVDPYGPRTVAEVRLDAGMRLAGAVGSHALVIGPQGSMILSATEQDLVAHPLPARGVPLAGGAAGSRLVVGWAAAIEEWDPQNRIPQRRIKLPRPAKLSRIGGSDRVVWFMTEGERQRIEVAPLVDRGQPRAHDLPEPIADIAGHPLSDLLVCLGADTGKLYVIDLDAREGMRVIDAAGIDRPEAAGLIHGRLTGVLAAQAHHAVSIVALDGSNPMPRAATFANEEGSTDHGVNDVATSVTLASPGPSDPAPGDWREALALWARSVMGGAVGGAPAAASIAALLARFELAPALYPALALLYGAHLAGAPGVAPLEVARVMGRRWEEALGRGQLAERGIAHYEGSRIRLAPGIQRELDADVRDGR
jgi:hypothetical protein